MPAVQTSYSEKMRTGVAGHIADMTQATLISRTAEAAVGFGVPAFQGVADNGMKLKVDADTVTTFLGVTVRDRSVAVGDAYSQYESARILREGSIWVVASVAVVAGDPVAVTSAGVWAKVAGTNGIVIPNARWETSAGIGAIARIALA